MHQMIAKNIELENDVPYLLGVTVLATHGFHLRSTASTPVLVLQKKRQQKKQFPMSQKYVLIPFLGRPLSCKLKVSPLS